MLVLLLLIFINTNFVNADDDSSETKYIELLPEKEKKEFIETIARRILEEVESDESPKTHVSGELSDDQLNVHSAYVSKLLKEESENLRRKIEENNNKEKSPKEVKEVTLQDLGKEDDGVDKIHELEKAIEKIEHLEHDKDDQLSEEVVNSTFHQETESGKIVDEDTVARVENTENLHNEEKEEKAVIDLTLRKGKDNLSKEEITTTDRTNDFIHLKSFKPKNSKKEAVSIEIEIIDKDKDYEENKKKGEIPVKVIYEDEKIARALNTSNTFSVEKAATDAPENIEVLFKDTKPESEAIRNNRRSLNLDSSHSEPNLDNNQAENRHYNEISRKKRMNNSSELKSQENSAKTHDEKSENEEQETEGNIEETTSKSEPLKDLEVSTEVATIKADDVAANMSTPNKEILKSPDKDNSNSTELDKPVERAKQTEIEVTSEKGKDITNEPTTNNMDHTESYSNIESSTISTVLIETEYTTSEKEIEVTTVTATLDATEELTNFTTTYGTMTKTNDNLTNVQETTSKSEKDIQSDTTDENLEPKATETVQVLRDSIVAYVTSTTVMPLTTTSKNITEENEKKPELQIMESPVIIKQGSIVDLQDQTGPREKIEQNIVVKDEIPKKTLRQGLLRPGFQKKNDRNVILLKIPPKTKEYVVYELLPGQKPFVERNPKQKKTQPLMDPKLTERDTRPQKNKYLYEEPSPQIEQPNFAPVYNYAPEFAFYNPHNKYGPNADDDNSNIVLLSNEFPNHQDNLNSYENNAHSRSSDDSGDSNSNIYNKQRKSSPVRSDRPSDMRPTDFDQKKRAKDNIDLDYYFGGIDRKEDRILRSRIKDPCQSRSCESEEVIVHQLPYGFPNSDSPEHAHNAMLNHNPPVTHHKQVKNILYNIGDFGYHFKYTTTPKVPKPWPLGATTLYQPPIDLLFNRNKESEKTIRSGLPGSPLKVFNSRSYYLDESPNTNDLRFSIKKGPKRSKLINIPYKNTVRYGKQKFDLKKRPLILLTGGLKDLSREIQGRPRQGNTLNNKDMNSFAMDYYLGRKESREKPSQKSRHKYKDNTFYDYALVDKKIKREKDNEYTDYSDQDVSSGEKYKLKTLDLKAMQLALNMTDISGAQNIFPALKQIHNLYVNHSKLLMRTVKSGEDINKYVNVLNDMIKTDSNALTKYDWLGTTVDIRSSIKKLKYLSEAVRNGKEDIDPKDLQLLKYILYLFKSVTEDIQSANERVETKENVELPRNLRFPISKHLQRLKNTRKYDFGKNEVIQEGPWLSKEGIKDKLVGFDKIIVDAENALNDLHDAIKHIALITQYRSQRWFQNLKELYLNDPGRKELLEVLLHLSLTKVLDHIEESAVHGLEDNYVSYAMMNPEQVEDTKAEAYFMAQILCELKSL